MIAGIRQGWLKLNIGAVLPLEQAIEAHELLEEPEDAREANTHGGGGAAGSVKGC